MNRRDFALGVASSVLTAGSLPPSPGSPSTAAHWSEAGLERVRAMAAELGVLGMIVRSGGQTILSYGDVGRPLRIASIRKSFLSALYGMETPAISLDTKLSDVGIDDYLPLTEVERSATIRDLLEARSGVYIPSAAETAAMKAARPQRGSHLPGTFWYYNNWDFNVLGEIYQRLTGKDFFVAFENQIARPLGFEDYDASRDARWLYDRDSPRFPAYNLWLSARDMARFGQMLVDGGRIDGKDTFRAGWLEESTHAWSRTNYEGLLGGYGYLCWISMPAPSAPTPIPDGTFTAAGNGGRFIVVLPKIDTVLSIQPNEDLSKGAPPVPLYADRSAIDRLVRQLVAAQSS